MKENPVKLQWRQQWQQMKDRPLKEKIVYLATYYRNYAIVLLAVLAALSYTAYEAATTKEIVLHVTSMNIWLQNGLSTEAIGQEFLTFAGLNPKKHQIVLENIHPDSNTGMSGMDAQIMAMLMASGEMDVMLATDTWIRQNRNQGMFADLSEVLPAELLEAYKDRIFYLNSTVDDKGEFPAAIDVSQSSLMLSPDLPAYFCVISTAENKESTALFLRYLLERQDG